METTLQSRLTRRSLPSNARWVAAVPIHWGVEVKINFIISLSLIRIIVIIFWPPPEDKFARSLCKAGRVAEGRVWSCWYPAIPDYHHCYQNDFCAFYHFIFLLVWMMKLSFWQKGMINDWSEKDQMICCWWAKASVRAYSDHSSGAKSMYKSFEPYPGYMIQFSI